MAQSLPRSFPRLFVIGLLIAAALLVMLGEKASAQDYASFYNFFLQPSYTVPGYDPSAAPLEIQPVNVAAPSTLFGPMPRPSPFGPLPSLMCGDPWTTPGSILYGGDVPLRVCVL